MVDKAVPDLCVISGDASGGRIRGIPLEGRKDAIGAGGYFLLFVSNPFSAAIGSRHYSVGNEGGTQHLLFTDLLRRLFFVIDSAVVRESQVFRDAGAAVDQSKV